MKDKSHSDLRHAPITIIGGGLAGKMMALSLATSCQDRPDFDITLISPDLVPDDETTLSPQKDKRTTTIHAAGAAMLQALGVWQDTDNFRTPITSMAVAVGPQRPYHSDWVLEWQDTGTPMAYVVENDKLLAAFDQALAKLAKQAPRKITFIDASVIDVSEQYDRASLTLSDNSILTSQLVIACDGANSAVRKQAGLTPHIQKTGQKAIVTNVRLEVAHNGLACQRFLETGPLALMPLNDENGMAMMASVVWSTSTKEADRLMMLDDAALSQEITQAFGEEFGKLLICDTPSCFPLIPQFNRRLSKGHVLLAGDAAHAIHPLAGMGYNLALADAAILQDELVKLAKAGLTADHPSLSSAYHRRRLPEITAMSAVTSGLNHLLSRPKNPVTDLLASAMAVVNHTGLKSQFRKIAMGGKLAKAPLLSGRNAK